jgi:hypothetical protein
VLLFPEDKLKLVLDEGCDPEMVEVLFQVLFVSVSHPVDDSIGAVHGLSWGPVGLAALLG